MQIRQATVTYYSPENPKSGVEICDLALDPDTLSSRFKFPLKQSLNVTQGTEASCVAQVLIGGQLQTRFSKEKWQVEQFTFVTRKPEVVKVVTVFRDRQFPKAK